LPGSKEPIRLVQSRQLPFEGLALGPPPSNELTVDDLVNDSESTSLKDDGYTLYQRQVLLDNILFREEEDEDAVIANSPVLLTLIERAEHEPASEDWERELDEI
jgi:hypothetical protein